MYCMYNIKTSKYHASSCVRGLTQAVVFQYWEKMPAAIMFLAVLAWEKMPRRVLAVVVLALLLFSRFRL